MIESTSAKSTWSSDFRSGSVVSRQPRTEQGNTHFAHNLRASPSLAPSLHVDPAMGSIVLTSPSLLHVAENSWLLLGGALGVRGERLDVGKPGGTIRENSSALTKLE